VVTRVVSSAKRTQTLKRSIRELGDVNAVLSEEAAVERDRRHRAREAIRSELEAQEDERKELRSALEELGFEAASLEDQLAESHEQELRDREEAAELEDRVARLRAESPRFHSEREELIRQIRELSFADAELQNNLRLAQERLWHQEARERNK